MGAHLRSDLEIAISLVVSITLHRHRQRESQHHVIGCRPGEEPKYTDIPSTEILNISERFLAIGEDVEKFKAFISDSMGPSSYIQSHGDLR
jgi:hypothetical protein